MQKWLVTVTAMIAWVSLPANADGTESSVTDDVLVRIIDVGAGHAAVVRMPNPENSDDAFYMVYDAGFRDYAYSGVKSVVPNGEEIDLMVLSHAHADHLGAVDEILSRYKVRKVIRQGYRPKKHKKTWESADTAIQDAQKSSDTVVIDPSSPKFALGAEYRFGEASVTIVSGFKPPLPEEWTEKWNCLKKESKRNAGSIVIRLTFKGKSVLFTGDAVGRCKDDDPDSDAIATEWFMVDNASDRPIDSDVLIAPHHGADDGSSMDFIKAVSPKWVIFPVGHKYEHPRAATARRYLAAEVIEANMLRTDRGDDEGPEEWDKSRIKGCEDKHGDDDIDVVIRANGQVDVAYRNPGKIDC